MKSKPLATAVLALCLASPAWSADDAHPHHIAAATGGAWHSGKSSVYFGLDYVYRFQNDFAVGVFIENVSGDFDLRAYGLTFGKFFSNGWKLGIGPGIEKKLKENKTLFLIHVTAGFDWHVGNWSIGPVASYDFIENNSNTFYLGAAVGYGF